MVRRRPCRSIASGNVSPGTPRAAARAVIAAVTAATVVASQRARKCRTGAAQGRAVCPGRPRGVEQRGMRQHWQAVRLMEPIGHRLAQIVRAAFAQGVDQQDGVGDIVDGSACDTCGGKTARAAFVLDVRSGMKTTACSRSATGSDRARISAPRPRRRPTRRGAPPRHCRHAPPSQPPGARGARATDRGRVRQRPAPTRRPWPPPSHLVPARPADDYRPSGHRAARCDPPASDNAGSRLRRGCAYGRGSPHRAR